MRKIQYFILLAVMLSVGFVAKADKERVITFQELPQAAKELIKTNFSGKAPMVVTVDLDDYEVYFESGEKIEFGKNGQWKEIVCKGTGIPAAIVPNQIKNQVKKSYPSAKIVKIERDHRGYEVKLNNGIEIEFDKAFKVAGIDD